MDRLLQGTLYGRRRGRSMSLVTTSAPIPAHPSISLPAAAGFDRIVLSAPTVSWLSAHPLPSCVASLPGYRCKRDHRISNQKSRYDRRSELRHDADPCAPILELLYQPREFPSPLFQLQVRAADRVLLDAQSLGVVAPLLRRQIGWPLLTVSEVELTLDFSPLAADFGSIRQQLYVPFANPARREDPTSWRYGGGGSRHSVRAYLRPDLNAVRVELNLRRDTLRNQGVSEIRTLAALPWIELCRRRLRFLELATHRGLPASFASYVEALGITAVMRALSAREAKRLWRKLRPTKFQRWAEEALAWLGDSLRAGVQNSDASPIIGLAC